MMCLRLQIDVKRALAKETTNARRPQSQNDANYNVSYPPSGPQATPQMLETMYAGTVLF